MLELKTQQDFRTVQNLPFCYLCGNIFTTSDAKTRDHVPPRKLFAGGDRANGPLILPVHDPCNQGESLSDEVMGQLVAVVHGTRPQSDALRRRLLQYTDEPSGLPRLAVQGIHIEPIIWRWIRAFHAALYAEHLPQNCRFALEGPFWSFTRTDNHLHLSHPQPVTQVFVDLLKKNRFAGILDRIEAWNGKCVYECAWTHADNGLPLCVFGLRLYDWERLGDKRMPRRGCVGCYPCANGPPKSAACEITIELLYENSVVLDPFGN